MPNIVTFGSCLSRRMASLMVKEQGWDLKSAVMQTKIGQYVRQLNGARPQLNELTVLDVLSMVKLGLKDYETVCNNISQQQGRVMGTFSTATEQDLDMFELVLKGEQLASDDLILIDTFADLLFRSSVNEAGEEIFAPVHKLSEEFQERWTLQPKESVAEIAQNVEALCAHIRQNQTSARIVVLNFPFGLNPSDDTKARASQLGSALSSSKFLHKLGVEVMSLPSPQAKDCSPASNYHHFRRTYYRSAVRLLASNVKSRSLVVMGDSELFDSIKSRLDAGVDFHGKYQQRVDAIVEREIWKSKTASSDRSALYAGRIDLEQFPEGAAIVIDARFNVCTRLSYGSIDEVGTANPALLPMVEKRSLSLKKMVVMIRTFTDWVHSQRPDCHVVLWLDDSERQLSERDQRRLEVLSRMTGALPLTLCTGNWLNLDAQELDAFLFGHMTESVED